MNVVLRPPMTLKQFLAWEERQELRFEFDGVQPIALAGGTAAHAAIQANLISALTTRLRGTRCRPYGSELKIKFGDGHIRYAEAFVVCAPVPPRATVVDHPVVVFEVLSDGSANDDLVLKNAEYRATPSVARYVVLRQMHAGAVVFMRKGADWVTDIMSGADAVLRMPEIAIEIPLAELYADLGLAAEDQAAPQSS